MITHIDEVTKTYNWPEICSTQMLSESFMRDNADVVDWIAISKFQHLSIEFINEFENVINWKLISQYQQLTESLIAQNYNRVDWSLITQYQVMSEQFIRTWQYHIWWSRLPAGKNKLSEQLIRDHADKLLLHHLVYYGHTKDRDEALNLGCIP